MKKQRLQTPSITISSTNYEDFTGTITVNSKNLHVLTYDPNGGGGGPERRRWTPRPATP